MIVMVSAITPPPPTPWIALATISIGMLSAAPDSTEPTRKITIADWNMRCRPYRSDKRPKSGVAVVAARR